MKMASDENAAGFELKAPTSSPSKILSTISALLLFGSPSTTGGNEAMLSGAGELLLILLMFLRQMARWVAMAAVRLPSSWYLKHVPPFATKLVHSCLTQTPSFWTWLLHPSWLQCLAFVCFALCAQQNLVCLLHPSWLHFLTSDPA